MANEKKLPEAPEPLWRADVDIPEFPPLEEDLEVDVVIVGGGLQVLPPRMS